LFSLYILLSFIGEIRDRQKLTTIFSQYVPPELVEEYSRDPGTISLEGEAREVTVLFCDVYGFTSISEKLEPRVLAQWLNRYFSIISQVVVEHGGTLDKYMGDSIMAFWGAPVHNESHAENALAAALDMQRCIKALSETYQAEGLPAISIGIGLSTGVSNVGNLGSQYRMSYTVVGDTVNTAQRLERQTRHYHVPIIVSASTAEKTEGMLYRELDIVKVKGREQFTRMFQPICPAVSATPELLENLAAHKRAMTYLMNKDWTSAARLFESLRERWSSDSVCDIYLKRIAKLRNP
ncbi:MAG: adenylate/guanylate cyclase domain-containing protein, partial [Gammaproteobacteria bacterium]|nr:adenylate/guanylate cyclase domain-containing protein [Gammaproteobacteria bacterium]